MLKTGWLVLLLLLPMMAFGQAFYEGTVTNYNGNPIPNSQVYVCASGDTATPCNGSAVAIYSDIGLQHALANPLTTDEYGYYYFYLVAGTYQRQAYAAGKQVFKRPFTSYLGTTSNFVVGPGTSSVGKVPTFANTSGSLLADSGKALPAGAIVGTTDAQSLTNKTMVAPAVTGGAAVAGGITVSSGGVAVTGGATLDTATLSTTPPSSGTSVDTVDARNAAIVSAVNDAISVGGQGYFACYRYTGRALGPCATIVLRNGFPLSTQNGNSNPGLTVGQDTTGLGLLFQSTESDKGGRVSHNALYNGTAWYALGTKSSSIAMTNGRLDFYANTGLSVGPSFSPTLMFRVTDLGFWNDGAAFKHVRPSGCTATTVVGSLFYCEFSVTWVTQFDDSNYTLVCTAEATTGASLSIVSKSATGFTLRALAPLTSTAVTADCKATHDGGS